MTLRMLPTSYRFAASVNRQFRDLYYEVMLADEKKKGRLMFTFKFSISLEAALQIFFEQETVL